MVTYIEQKERAEKIIRQEMQHENLNDGSYEMFHLFHVIRCVEKERWMTLLRLFVKYKVNQHNENKKYSC